MVRLSKTKRELLNKSRESALLAVDIYNKPSTKFRSYGYIVLMVIAWASLFHAIFEKRGIKYYYKKEGTSRYIYIDGEKKAWELSQCIDEFYGGQNSPVKDNLRFFVGLRNKIEHRFLPALDLKVFSECQSLLLNYEKLLTTEFGEEFSLNESLAIPLQLLSVNPEWKKKVLKQIEAEEYEIVSKYIDTFRGTLDIQTWNSTEYSFKVFLVPIIGNSQHTADKTVEFVKFDPSRPEEMNEYERLVTFIKEKQVPVANLDGHKASEVCEFIKNRLNIKCFSPAFHHAMCWSHYRIRPVKGDNNPSLTNPQYCRYDAVHKDYVYTDEWQEFLAQELMDEEKRIEIGLPALIFTTPP
jgi:hypothetical protein